VNGTERQKGDLTELIWSVPEIIAKLSEQVSLGAGDIIMTGTPAGVAALSPGDKVECGVDGIATLKVTIGKPEIRNPLTTPTLNEPPSASICPGATDEP
jgi:fumarylpyruvate hydrolase